MKPKTRPERLRDAVHARGVWTRDLRDAAHEAHHALACRLRGRWTRERIDSAVERKFSVYADRVKDEQMARAVEQIVCKRLRVKTWTIEKAVEAMRRESAEMDGEDIGDLSAHVAEIERLIKTRQGKRAADRVLSLIGATP